MALVATKMLIYTYVVFNGHDFFGGGNDSDYYDRYALGYDETSVNIWPDFLRFLNDVGLYSRSGVSFFLFIVGIIFVPYLSGKISDISGDRKLFYIVFFIVGIYPTIFYYTFDIYRDVLMIFLFLLGVYFLKICVFESKHKAIFLFGLGFLFSWVLYLFRPYLGFGYFIMLIGGYFFNIRKVNLKILFLIYLFILQVVCYMGFLDPIFSYRRLFFDIADMDGGSNLGIEFASREGFVVDFSKSIVFQIFGLFFVNISSVFVFFLESVPFIFMLSYVLKNKIYTNKFIDFLMLFFIVYSTVWLLGNDNLGSAVRLRVFGYLVVLFSAAIVYQNKLMGLKGK